MWCFGQARSGQVNMFGLYGLQAQRARASADRHNAGYKPKLNKRQRKKMLQRQRDIRDRRKRSPEQLSCTSEADLSSLQGKPVSCLPAAGRRVSPSVSRCSSALSDCNQHLLPASRSRSPSALTSLSCQGSPQVGPHQRQHPPPPPPPSRQGKQSGGHHHQQQQGGGGGGGGGGEAGMVTASLESLARLFSCVAVSRAPRPPPHHRYTHNHAMHG